ncbi:MAG: hypothetical protein AMXMBFR46_24080 [Acidimicrobiia bacterium]
MLDDLGHTVVVRLDRWQRRHRIPSFTVAIAMRYREDRGREFGALLSYYGFISLFPLLLVLVTVLGIVLDDNAELRNRILDTVYARIPVVGAQLRAATTSLDSSGVLLLVGLLVTLWAGLAVVKHAQDALNLQWGVPRFRQPGFVSRTVRAVGALAVVGLGIVLATVATNLAAFLPGAEGAARVLGSALAIVINILVLTTSYRVLIGARIPWRGLLPGGLVGGIALWALQLVGGEYVARVILDAGDVYGAFAIVFGLLVWIALLARVILLANEVNVVRERRLWPRSFAGSRSTDADSRAIEDAMRREALLADVQVRLKADDSANGL